MNTKNLKTPPQNREISWLSFNERVLQEAGDHSVKPITRLYFLGIVSSNLDEFYRVRVGSLNLALQKLSRSHHKKKKEIYDLLDIVRARTLSIQERVAETLADILSILKEQHGITLADTKNLNAKQLNWVNHYFQEQVRSSLSIVANCTSKNLDKLITSDSIYLAVRLSHKKKIKPHLAIVELPADSINRFIILPENLCAPNTLIYLWLDDIIRVGLSSIFEPLGYTAFEAYTVKFTRNAEFTVDNDFVANYIEQLSSKIKQRDHANFVRLTYDEAIPQDTLQTLLRLVKMDKGASMIAGGRYHNFRDFSDFPVPKSKKGLINPPQKPIVPEALVEAESTSARIEKNDILLHYPYHSFEHIIHLLRESALDPDVKRINMTIYRTAKKSDIVSALINALLNGKEVVVFLELKARFNEEVNMVWVKKLEEAGAIVLTSLPNYKVHAKLLQIVRHKKPNLAVVATGNFNEISAKFYSDFSLLTANKEINEDVENVFSFLLDPTRHTRPRKLLVSPRYMRKKIMHLIRNEIRSARAGLKASIRIKINNLVDAKVVQLLDKAAKWGVHIDIVVRSTCALNPDLPKYNGRMRIVSIVDEYLEHTRILIFHNQGQPLIYISSADLMKRNLDHRVEVATPIISNSTRQQVLDIFNYQINDNCKARIVNDLQDNQYQKTKGERIRAQSETRRYLKQSGS